MEELFNIYKQMLLIHIGTKTNDLLFHQASEKFYETLFDIFHQTSEKRQDTEEDDPTNCEDARASAYNLLDKAKTIVESLIKSKTTVGMDNLLRGFIDKLEFDIGTARGLTMQYIDEQKKDQEAESTEKTDVTESKKESTFTK